MVEIRVDFANCFWLDPIGEIRLKPTVEIWLKSIGEIWLKYLQTVFQLNTDSHNVFFKKYILQTVFGHI